MQNLLQIADVALKYMVGVDMIIHLSILVHKHIIRAFTL